MPEHEFEIYLSVLSRLMKLDEQQKAAIADELSDHLEQRFEELVRSGLGRDEAIRQALDEFGDASGLAVDLTRVSQKRIRRIIMRSSFATAALLLVGFGWVFLFPPANAELETEPRLIAEDHASKAGEAAAAKKKPPVAPVVAAVEISLDRDSSDFDAPVLQESTTVNFAELPLVDALEFLCRNHEVPILLDAVALEEAGLQVDEPINFVIAGIRLDQLLDLMLTDLELTWYVENGIMQVTTIEKANEHLVNRSYDLAPFRKAGIEPGSLVEIVIQETNAWWEEVDGHGGKVSIVGNVMTIRQAYQAHREVQHLLEAILQPGWQPHGIYHSDYLACLQALETPVTVNFSELPLVDAVEFLSRTTESAIFLDGVSIEEAGLLVDEPVSLVMSDQSLATMLHLILRDLELTTTIRSGELYITPVEVADDDFHTVVYDVRNTQDPKQLSITLQSLTSGMWEEVEGYGGTLSLTENGLLVIRQSDRIHREIADLLQTHAGTKTDTAIPPPKKKLETRFYRMPSETAEDLMKALPTFVAPETWQVITPPGIAPDRNPQAVGTIRKVAVGQKVVQLSAPRATSNGKKGDSKQTGEKAAPKPPPEVILVSESVLVIEQTVEVHNRMNEFIRLLGLTDAAFGRKPGGLGSGGSF